MLGADRCNFAYARETGLIDEILIERLRRDSIGSYETWGLVLRDLVRGEPRIDLFEGVTITEASNNQAGDRIKSIVRAVAAADQRSLSNQVVIILREWINRNGYDIDESVDGRESEASTQIS